MKSSPPVRAPWLWSGRLTAAATIFKPPGTRREGVDRKKDGVVSVSDGVATCRRFFFCFALSISRFTTVRAGHQKDLALLWGNSITFCSSA